MSPINVQLAENDSAFLREGYRSAVAGSLPAVIEKLEGRVNQHGRVSINCPAAELAAFLRDQEYKNRHRLVRDGQSEWDAAYALRNLVEERLGYGSEAKQIVYGSLNIGNCGYGHYGEYCIVLRKDSTVGRTSFLEDDAFEYFSPNLIGSALIGEVPAGSRATWDNVSQLAVAKLHRQDQLSTVSPRDIPTMNKAIVGFSHCIEAHVYGKLTPDDVEEVRVPLQLIVRVIYLRDILRRRSGRLLPPDDQFYLDMHLVAIELVEDFGFPLVPTAE